jgi:hypothetical protein
VVKASTQAMVVQTHNDILSALCLIRKMEPHIYMVSTKLLVVMVYILLVLDTRDNIFSRKDIVVLSDNELAILWMVGMS